VPSLLFGGATSLITNVSGNWPTPKLEWSPTTNPADAPVWVDITSKLRRFSINRGRRNWLSQMSPGTATFDLDNTAGDFTPANASSTYYPNVIPGKRVRFSVSFGGVTYNRYVGFTTGYPTGWKNTDSQVTLTCVDGLGLLNLALMNGVYAMSVLADSPTAFYEFKESSGPTAVDASPNRNAGIYSASGITWAQVDPITDGSDHAVQFDGQHGYVTTPSFSMSSNWSVEAWFLAPSATNVQTIVASDQTLYPRWSITVGGAGIGVIDANVAYSDATTTTYTSLATNYADGAWHHVVLTWSAGNILTLYVDGVSNSSGSSVAATFPTRPITIGPVDEGSGATTLNMVAVAIWTGTTLSAVRVLAHYQARNAWLNDLSNARISHVLDAVSWSNSDRNILGIGSSTLSSADDAAGKSALAAINEATTSENGLTFIDQSGRLTFIPRNLLQLAPYSTSQGTFGDNVAEIAYPMGDGKITLDDQDLWTQVNVQRKGGPLFTATASTAVVNQFYTVRRPATVTSLANNDVEPQQLANWLMNQSSVAAPRVDTINMKGTAGNLANILPRELGDLVTYKGRPAGVGTVSQAARILGMKESGDLKERVYHTSWLLFAREPQAMVWSDATYGFWDTYPWGI
jgi:hypothetical protein